MLDHFELLRNLVACFKIDLFVEISPISTNSRRGLDEFGLIAPKRVIRWILTFARLNNVN